jgi:signal transduction histidine kinase
MKEIEITSPPLLDEEKQRTADLHSFFNILGVVTLQLDQMSLDFPEWMEEFEALTESFVDLSRKLRSQTDIQPIIRDLDERHQSIFTLLKKIEEFGPSKESLEKLVLAGENFESIYGILKIRLEELIFRINDPDVWIAISPDELREQTENVFQAIEKNAHGMYYVHFNLALKKNKDYYVDLHIDSKRENGLLWIPLRLKDILRDLLANARKYTKPGGKVALALYQDKEGIRCVIEDTGCGIPDDEIEKVVEFGYRASNVRDRPTMGGGFGLTKASWLILSWGGRFLISSEENKGTKISIFIPETN